jgi:hypothetical protein
MAASQLGDDQIALDATACARRIGQELGLFGVAPSEKQITMFRQMSEQKYRMTVFAAWSTYSWMTLHSLFFHDEPIAFPPSLPIPGDLDDASSYNPPGEWPAIPVPSYMGHTFSMMSKFWVIVQEIMAVYLGPKGRANLANIPLAFAEAKYQKLLQWSDAFEKHIAEATFYQFHILVVQ